MPKVGGLLICSTPNPSSRCAHAFHGLHTFHPYHSETFPPGNGIHFFLSSLRMSFVEVYLMISTIKFLHSVVEYALRLGVLPIIHQKSECFVVERNDSEEKFPTIFNESFNQPKRIEQTCNRIINNGEQS